MEWKSKRKTTLKQWENRASEYYAGWKLLALVNHGVDAEHAFNLIQTKES